MGFLTILIIMIVLLSFFRLLGRMLAVRRQTSADSSPERNTLAGMFSTRRVDAEVWMACAANTDLEYIRPQNGKGFPCLRGNVNGRLTDVHIQEEDGSCCTVASVLFRAPEKAGLRILLDDEPVLRAFFAGQPVYRLSGIDDPRLRCAASSENALSEALTFFPMNILKNALGFFRYLNVTDQYVMIRVPGICNDEDALVHLINFIISFAGNWEKGPSAFPAGPILVEHAEPVPELKTPKTAPPSSEPVPEREVEFNPESAEEEKEEFPAVPEQEIAAIGADSRMRISLKQNRSRKRFPSLSPRGIRWSRPHLRLGFSHHRFPARRSGSSLRMQKVFVWNGAEFCVRRTPSAPTSFWAEDPRSRLRLRLRKFPVPIR